MLLSGTVHNRSIGIYSNRIEGFYYYLGFLLWPLGAVLVSLRNWEKPWSRNVFWFFCLFFGFTFIIAEEGGADSERYASLLLSYSNSDWTLNELWNSFYAENSSNVDIAQPLLTFLVSRVTDNPVILFMVFGLIFGYFYSRNLWYVLSRIKGNLTPVLLLFLLTFGLLNPIWNLNGFRMWTAAQMFVFGTLPYLLERKSSNLPWAMASVFMHFSFLFPVLILFVFILVKNRLTLYLGFFIISAFIKELDLELVRSSLSFLPGMFQARVTAYTNSDYAEAVMLASQTVNWYVPFSEVGIKWAIYLMAISAYFFHKNILKSQQSLLTIFSFSLLLYGWANIFSLVPSGGRFITLASVFMFVFFILSYSIISPLKYSKVLFMISLPFLFLYIIVSMRIGMDFCGISALIGNPISASIFQEHTPLIEVFKGLL